MRPRLSYQITALSVLALPALLTACASSRTLEPSHALVASTRLVSDQSRLRGGSMPRHVIKTARILLKETAFERQAARAHHIVKGLGGHVQHANNTENHASLTLRVPAASFGDAVAALKKLGELESLRVRGQDVTARVVDLELRLENLLKARKRYLELLAKAASVKEALPVQQQLTSTTTQIESLKGQLKLMRQRVQLSTIFLTIEKPVRPGVVGWVFVGLYKGVRWLFVWD